MTLSIRELADVDLKPADSLLNIAFNSSVSRLGDLHLYRRIQPDGWFGAFCDGQLVGTVGAASYDVFAHVGFMVVHPEMQGQGIGRALMEFLLARLDQQGVTIITLDASKMGHPLYKKLGFAECSKTIVFEHQGKPSQTVTASHVSPITLQDMDELVEIDTAIFGANRRKVFAALLDAYPTRGLLQRDADGKITGYLFAMKNRIGPWVTLQPGKSEELLQAALMLSFDDSISAFVPIENHEAAKLLSSHGFRQIRINPHMKRGSGELPGQRQKICAQTSLAVG